MENAELMKSLQQVLQDHAANGPPAAPAAPAALAPLAPVAPPAAPGWAPPVAVAPPAAPPAAPPVAFAGAPAWAAPAPAAGALPPPQGWSVPVEVPATGKYGQGKVTVHLAFAAETFPMAPKIIEAIQQAGYEVRIFVPKPQGGFGSSGGYNNNNGGGFARRY